MQQFDNRLLDSFAFEQRLVGMFTDQAEFKNLCRKLMPGTSLDSPTTTAIECLLFSLLKHFRNGTLHIG